MLERVDRFARDPSTSPWMRFRYSIRLSASLGELALAQGDLEQARRHAERCLELAGRTNARKNLVKGWRLAGEVATTAGRWDEAEQALREALVIAEAIGNPTQLWRTYGAIELASNDVRVYGASTRRSFEALAVRLGQELSWRGVYERTAEQLDRQVNKLP
jgi:tetratricopeptide (TPR) repeat protein